MAQIHAENRHGMRRDDPRAAQQRSVTAEREQRVELLRVVEPFSAAYCLVQLALLVEL